MKKLTIFIMALICIFGAGAATVSAQNGNSKITKNWGVVCGMPITKGCSLVYKNFAPYELAFNTGGRGLTDGMQATSNDFYAVIIETREAGAGECNVAAEKDRLAAQKLFPLNKVFASHYGCKKDYAVYYNDNFNGKSVNIMAIYAGTTVAEAKKVLAVARKYYPGCEYQQFREDYEIK